jgi:hypothetical protein
VTGLVYDQSINVFPIRSALAMAAVTNCGSVAANRSASASAGGVV